MENFDELLEMPHQPAVRAFEGGRVAEPGRLDEQTVTVGAEKLAPGHEPAFPAM